MVTAGALHFIATDAYLSIMPDYFPRPLELVYISGVCEILGGAGLLIPRLRRVAGIGLIALFVAVLPANFNMAIHDIQPLDIDIPQILLWLRLPMQLVLIAWAWWVSSENT